MWQDGATLGCRELALGTRVSVVEALRLWSTGSVVVAHRLSCSTACGIFLEQGLNQGSPETFFLEFIDLY